MGREARRNKSAQHAQAMNHLKVPQSILDVPNPERPDPPARPVYTVQGLGRGSLLIAAMMAAVAEPPPRRRK